MDTTKIRRLQPLTSSSNHSCSPRLRRSSSTSSSSAISLADRQSSKPKSPQTSTIRPSRSATTSPRLLSSVNNARIATKAATTKEKVKDKDIEDTDGSKMATMNHLRSSTIPRNMGVKRVISSSSPIWAASSSGQPRSPCPLPESPKMTDVSRSEGGRIRIGGVLKYFSNHKQKKASLVLEEFHQYRILYNRLIQWRFANARADAAMATLKLKAEEKVLCVWLRVYKITCKLVEKRMIVQRLRQKIKLLEIICPEIELLNEWEKLEKRNLEALGRVTRKLSAISTKLPLVHGAKLDAVSLYDAMSLAMEVMECVEESIVKFIFQAERACCLLRELVSIIAKHDQCYQELDKAIAHVTFLEAEEKSIRTYLIQANKDATRDHNDHGICNPLCK
ncbi:hypothetical protein Dimus_000492 [Dionaea muscipula]